MDVLNILTALTASIVTCIFWIIRLHQVEKLKEDWKQLAFKSVQAAIDSMELLKKNGYCSDELNKEV